MEDLSRDKTFLIAHKTQKGSLVIGIIEAVLGTRKDRVSGSVSPDDEQGIPLADDVPDISAFHPVVTGKFVQEAGRSGTGARKPILCLTNRA